MRQLTIAKKELAFMSTHLCIQLSSLLHTQTLETDFLYNEEWNADSEALLLQRLHEVLSLVRSEANSLTLRLEIQVADPNESMFQIKKNLHHHSHIALQHYKLSLREIEVLGLIMQGHTNSEIAKKLFISYETVKSHRKNILTKTGARNTAALINHYHQTFFEK
jgi:DNA-binding CsgD family transcriptional regulator